jgi:ADP-ribose pyrophosphatase YjhB (NUDIX family)
MDTNLCNTVKGVIFKDDSVLLIKKEYEDGSFLYTLPGGSQIPGETLEEALIREIYEETAASVTMVDLIRVYEYQKVSRKNPLLIRHKVEFAFYCRIVGSYTPVLGAEPDSHQTEVLWMQKKALPELNLSPQALQDVLVPELIADSSHYLGKVL